MPGELEELMAVGRAPDAPSSSRSMAFTTSSCPPKVSRSAPVAASQTRTSMSPEPLASRVWSALSARLMTLAWWCPTVASTLPLEAFSTKPPEPMPPASRWLPSVV
jgi:hypothetical protein